MAGLDGRAHRAGAAIKSVREIVTDQPDDEYGLELLGAMKRIENKNRKRGHASYWHGEREFQDPMPICKIKGNRDDPPEPSSAWQAHFAQARLPARQAGESGADAARTSGGAV